MNKNWLFHIDFQITKFYCPRVNTRIFHFLRLQTYPFWGKCQRYIHRTHGWQKPETLQDVHKLIHLPTPKNITFPQPNEIENAFYTQRARLSSKDPQTPININENSIPLFSIYNHWPLKDSNHYFIGISSQAYIRSIPIR